MERERAHDPRCPNHELSSHSKVLGPKKRPPPLETKTLPAKYSLRELTLDRHVDLRQRGPELQLYPCTKQTTKARERKAFFFIPHFVFSSPCTRPLLPQSPSGNNPNSLRRNTGTGTAVVQLSRMPPRSVLVRKNPVAPSDPQPWGARCEYETRGCDSRALRFQVISSLAKGFQAGCRCYSLDWP